jgi:hypothetical protein
MTRIIKSLPFPGHPREMKNIYPFAKGCQRKKGPCPPSLFIFVHDFRMMVRTRRGGVARRPNGRINPSSSPPLFLRKKRAQKTYGLAATAEVKGCQKKRLCHHSPTLPPSLRVPCNLIGKGVDYKEVGKGEPPSPGKGIVFTNAGLCVLFENFLHPQRPELRRETGGLRHR